MVLVSANSRSHALTFCSRAGILTGVLENKANAVPVSTQPPLLATESADALKIANQRQLTNQDRRLTELELLVTAGTKVYLDMTAKGEWTSPLFSINKHADAGISRKCI